MDFIPVPSILVADLLECHPDYKVDLIQKYQDFYDGGEKFEAHKDKYLTKRTIELSDSPGGKAYRQSRLNAAYYTDHAAGVIDWLVSACLQSQPSISATPPEDAKPKDLPMYQKKCEFYNDLNLAKDGKHDLVTLILKQLREAMVQYRSYFSIVFPDLTLGQDGLPVTHPSPAHARDAGDLDGEICGLKAVEVDDWEEEDKQLKWVRTHCITYSRNKPYGKRNVENHCWTYITPTACYEYQATKSVDKEWDLKTDSATLKNTYSHSLQALPVVQIKVTVWLMNRIFTIAHGLYNREASADFALDMSGCALPTLILGRNAQGIDDSVSEIVASEMACTVLHQGGDLKFATPDPGHHAALRESANTKRENLYLAVQSASQLAGGKPDSGRASGVAKKYDAEQIRCLLTLFAHAIRDALLQVLHLLQVARNDEDIVIKIIGLEKYSVAQIESQLDQVITFMGLPGASLTAKKDALERISLNLCADATPETKKKIIAEIADIKSLNYIDQKWIPEQGGTPDAKTSPATAPAINNSDEDEVQK